MKNYFLIFVFFSLALIAGQADGFSQQDPQYSQYMFNRLAVNPAYAGSRDVMSCAMMYRHQWVILDENKHNAAPSTAEFSLQAPFKNKKAGMGFELISDKLGLRKTSAALVSYAYRMQFLKGKLAFGLRSGIYNYVFDWSAVHVKDETDIYNTGVSSSKVTGTADFGIYYNTRNFYSGLGLTHLNRGRITDIDLADSSARQSVHYFIPAGISFEKGNMLLNPSILIKGAGHAPIEADINMNVLMKERVWFGISLRTRYGIAGIMQYLVTDKLKVGYSYDYGFGGIGKIGGSTHEIMIGYDLNFKGAKVETLRYF